MFVVAASLRILFDEDYSYLLHEASGSYLPGYILVTIGILLVFSGCIGCFGVVKSNTVFLGLVFELSIDKLSDGRLISLIYSVFHIDDNYSHS